MAIFRGSRYRNVDTIQVDDGEGNVESSFELRATTDDPPAGSVPYLTKAGDTFESLAASEYGDGNKWYILADVNPQVFWPLDLGIGVEIVIPPRSYAELA